MRQRGDIDDFHNLDTAAVNSPDGGFATGARSFDEHFNFA